MRSCTSRIGWACSARRGNGRAAMQPSHRHTLLYWVGSPQQHRIESTTPAYRRLLCCWRRPPVSLPVGAGGGICPLATIVSAPSGTAAISARFLSPPEPAPDAKIQRWTLVAGEKSPRFPPSAKPCYTLRIVDDPGPIQLTLAPLKYTTALDGTAGSWCLQILPGSTTSPNEVPRKADDPNRC